MRFLFYSHNGFGLGHTCHNLGIVRALTELAPRASGETGGMGRTPHIQTFHEPTRCSAWFWGARVSVVPAGSLLPGSLSTEQHYEFYQPNWHSCALKILLRTGDNQLKPN
jgi:hypothetical protein